jgi:outer membrane protein TolC
VSLPGCHLTWWPWRREPSAELLTDVELKEYREWATSVDFPSVATEPPAPELFAAEPRRLRDRTKDQVWDVTLQEAVHIALSHSDIIRSSGQFLSPGNPILANPGFAPSAYDVAIQESGVLFGQRGVEAALSEFDTQFTTTMTWGRNEQIQNNLFDIGIQPGQTLTQETANFNAALQKSLATGGIFSLTHQWDYEWDNVQSQLFPSVYTGQLRTEFRQPLLAGAGTEYTRIAGPITQNIEGITGVQQGVVIARINGDISVADFEQAVTGLVRDVEDLYWRLYLAYQQFDAESSLHQEALGTWRGVNARVLAEAAGGSAIEETEALDLLAQIEARRNAAHQNLYEIEAQLRRMMGLVPNDGRIIRPIDQPIIAEYRPDWHLMLTDALVRRAELRKQKWNIKSLELQLQAAEHLTKPRLDFVSSYQVNGFGDDLFGKQTDGRTRNGLGSAYRTLTGGDQTGWEMGFEFSLPLGLRFAHAQVRNMQFQLAKARAALAAQEIEISHELAAAFRKLDSAYVAMEDSLNRKVIAEKHLQALAAVRQAASDRVTDLNVLRAQDQVSQAQSAYLQAITDYNIAIMDLYYRSGTLLGLDNVHLAEGPWTPEARFDAEERAAARARTIPTATMLQAEPAPFAQPVGDFQFSAPAADAGPALHGWPELPSPPAEALEPLPQFVPLPEFEPLLNDGPSIEPRQETGPREQQEAPSSDPPRLFPPKNYPSGDFPAAEISPAKDHPVKTPPEEASSAEALPGIAPPGDAPSRDVPPTDVPPKDLPPADFPPVDVPPADKQVPEFLRQALEKRMVAAAHARPVDDSPSAIEETAHDEAQATGRPPSAMRGHAVQLASVEPDAWLPKHLIATREANETPEADATAGFQLPLCEPSPPALASPLILASHVQETGGDARGGFERPLAGAPASKSARPAIATDAVEKQEEFQFPFREPFLASLGTPLILVSHVDDSGKFERPVPATSPGEFAKPAMATHEADDNDGFQLPFRAPSFASLARPVVLASHVDACGEFERPLSDASESAFATPLLPMRNVDVTDRFRR